MMNIYCECRISAKTGKGYWCIVGETCKGDVILTFDKDVINRLFDGITYREGVGYKEYYERG